MTKTCINCNKTKPVADFYRSKGAKDGLLNPCKDCRKTGRRFVGLKMVSKA